MRMGYRSLAESVQGSGLRAIVKALADEAPSLIGGLSARDLRIGSDTRRVPRLGPTRFPYIDAGHDCIDLCCAVAGECIVEMGGRCFRVRGGHVCLIPPRLRHADTFVERLSPNYLCSLFRKHTGRTILTHLSSLRMTKAEELLLGSGLSVKEIAKETGFRSANYFSRTFRRVHGASPSAFRKRHAGARPQDCAILRNLFALTIERNGAQ